MSVQEDSRQKQLKKWQEKLPEEWRQNQLGADTAGIYKEITNVAMATVALEMAQKMDPDLAALKEQVKVANEPYQTGKKTNTMKIEFAVDVLKGRGEDVPSMDVFLSSAAKRMLN